MTTPDVADVRAALAEIGRRIDAVDRSWTHPVEITAVTKAFPPTIIETAVNAGCTSIGENYAQDLLTKRPTLESLPHTARPRVDFIGHLQSNKVRQLVGLVDRWCTVDRRKIIDEIARRDPGGAVLVQVNATGEAAKAGCAPTDVAGIVAACRDAGLRVEGLLAIGPTNGDPVVTLASFVAVRGLVDELGLAVCSMGMSGDLDIAVACGATNVRIGSSLFGPRPGAVHQDGIERG